MKVNGCIHTLKAPVGINTFLKENGYKTGRVAIELNGDILPKSKYESTLLSDSDTLEIVHFVGGG